MEDLTPFFVTPFFAFFVTPFFAGSLLDWPDTRADYGEDRYITFGGLDGRMVVVVWTPRGAARRIISMRKANDREIKKHAQKLG